jgi:hypothetical protein
MELAARIGLSLEQWQQMTPRELRIWAGAYLNRIKTREREDKVRIYNLASLTRAAIWAKHMPRFEEVFPEKTGPMDDDQMFKTAQALNKLFGGTED